MITAAPPTRYRDSVLRWDFMGRGWAYGAASLGAFALLYVVLVLIGLRLHEDIERLTILWPASGVLLMALWLAPLRNWPWILLTQWAIELAADSALAGQVAWSRYAPFVFANSLDAVVAALIASKFITVDSIPRMRNVLAFIAVAAIGSAASAVVGAFASAHTLGGAEYLREWQVWWAGNWLGSLCVAPIVILWMVRWRAREPVSSTAGPIEATLIVGALLSLTVWIFSTPPGGASTIFDLPFILLALVIVAAFRMPSRWSTSLTAVTAVMVAYFSSRGLGPFAGDPNPLLRVGAVQLYLATLVAVNVLLTIALAGKRMAFQLLRTSGERYRNFVEYSSEAMWRIELELPMDPALPAAEQISWLQTHGDVAEGNRSYQQLNRDLGLTPSQSRRWRADAPWYDGFIAKLEEAVPRDYVMDGLQFTMAGKSGPRTFIAGFRGVMEQGQVVRIWGVARDISELAELNERLRENQTRLKLYAREIVGAEERARRATAVDLHDGIGQQLVGLSMTLNAAVGRAPPEVRLLLGEATRTVREVQAIAQRVIADLSPPGLYELGLEPALKWLSIYMRGKDELQVNLRVAADDAAIDLELRVLVFKVIRELLRNVVKHSGVHAANVTVTSTAHELRAVVEDEGVGFEWQLSLFEPRALGFGLWSVVDRVREAAGEVTVDTGPGKGCRVSVVFPLQAAERARQAG